MTIQSLSDLKSKFQTGDTPTQQDFADLLDSFAHLTDTLGAYQVLIRNSTGSPAAGLSVPASSIIGRKDTGDIVALTVSEAQSLLGTGIPTGCMMPYGGASAPAGWLLCNGSAVSRSTYAALYTSIGSSFGDGDGSTTFNLPDLRGRAATGADADHALGTAYGAATFDAHHAHTVTPNILAIHEGETPTPTNVAAPTEVPTTEATLTIDTVSPSLALNWIIKA